MFQREPGSESHLPSVSLHPPKQLPFPLNAAAGAAESGLVGGQWEEKMGAGVQEARQAAQLHPVGLTCGLRPKLMSGQLPSLCIDRPSQHLCQGAGTQPGSGLHGGVGADKLSPALISEPPPRSPYRKLPVCFWGMASAGHPGGTSSGCSYHQPVTVFCFGGAGHMQGKCCTHGPQPWTQQILLLMLVLL